MCAVAVSAFDKQGDACTESAASNNALRAKVTTRPAYSVASRQEIRRIHPQQPVRIVRDSTLRAMIGIEFIYEGPQLLVREVSLEPTTDGAVRYPV